MEDLQTTEVRKKSQSELQFEQNQKFEHYLSQLTTELQEKKVSIDGAYKTITSLLEKSNLDETAKDYWLDRWECHLHYQRTPCNAIKEIYEYAENIKKECGERAKYPCWVSVKEHRKTMYLLMLILGAWGRDFLFGTPAIAALSHVALASVQRFLQTAISVGFIACVWKDLKGNMYRLEHKEDHLAWYNVPRAVGVEGLPDTRNDIMDSFFWMFDCRNPMNHHALETYSPGFLDERQR